MMSNVCYSGHSGSENDVVDKKSVDVELSGSSVLTRSPLSEVRFAMKSTVLLPKTAANSLRKHCWGPFRVLPKTSGLSHKSRPLGSYGAHCLKSLFRLTSSVIQWVCSKVFPGDDSVLSFSSVIRSAVSYNGDLAVMEDSGRDIFMFSHKVDIDNFFGYVPKDDVISAWQYCVHQY